MLEQLVCMIPPDYNHILLRAYGASSPSPPFAAIRLMHVLQNGYEHLPCTLVSAPYRSAGHAVPNVAGASVYVPCAVAGVWLGRGEADMWFRVVSRREGSAARRWTQADPAPRPGQP